MTAEATSCASAIETSSANGSVIVRENATETRTAIVSVTETGSVNDFAGNRLTSILDMHHISLETCRPGSLPRVSQLCR